MAYSVNMPPPVAFRSRNNQSRSVLEYKTFASTRTPVDTRERLPWHALRTVRVRLRVREVHRRRGAAAQGELV